MNKLRQCPQETGGWLLLILPALESHDAVVACERDQRARKRDRKTAIVRRDDRMQRFFSAEGARQLATAARLHAVHIQPVWYPWTDEGVAH